MLRRFRRTYLYTPGEGYPNRDGLVICGPRSDDVMHACREVQHHQAKETEVRQWLAGLLLNGDAFFLHLVNLLQCEMAVSFGDLVLLDH